jgi:hypothetical protein
MLIHSEGRNFIARSPLAIKVSLNIYANLAEIKTNQSFTGDKMMPLFTVKALI